MRDIFHIITPLKVPDEIVRHIKSMIKKGKLSPGEKLPSERTLAGLFGVGRSTLREAMNTLSTLGFIEIKERKGAFVKSMGETVIPDTVAQILDGDQSKVKDLYDLRMDLEVAAAFMAAKHRNPEHLQLMDGLLKSMEAQISAPRLGIDEDIQFHLAIARASGNVLRFHVLESLLNRYGHFIDVARQRFYNGPAHNQTICTYHRKIYAAIEMKKPVVARKAMVEHLSMVAAHWD